MEKEFNLSAHVEEAGYGYLSLPLHKVKEFIKKLKEELCKELLEREKTISPCYFDRIPQIVIRDTIDKLAGEKLI